MINETWRAVPGYEAGYEVSSCGKVRSLPRKGCRGRNLRLILQANGYYSVALSRSGTVRRFYVHTLVALAFIGPRERGMEVCHGDGDPLNNRVANLRYGTRRENAADMLRRGRHGGTKGSGSPRAKLHESDVPEIKAGASAGATHRELAAVYGVGHRIIGRLLRGEAWRHVQ